MTERRRKKREEGRERQSKTRGSAVKLGVEFQIGFSCHRPMPSKVKELEKKNSKKDTLPEEDPLVFLKNYKAQAHKLGVKSFQSIIQSIENDGNATGQLIVTSNDKEHLGPCGCRALVHAILGENCDSKYIGFKDIRIIGSKIGNIGACSIARLLNKCDDSNSYSLFYLDLSENGMDSKGCLALGRSLCAGMNTTLLSLKLDHNEIGSEGLHNLARGLVMNRTLKRLSLRYCNIDGSSVKESIPNILSNPHSRLISIDLSGNNLGGEGLSAVNKGLEKNALLQSLFLADNGITSKDIHPIEAFSRILYANKSLLEIDFSANFIGDEGGKVLENGLSSNTTVTSFKLDTTLNDSLYDKISRQVEGGKLSTTKKKKK